jgi:hypothetical protein
MNDEGKVDDQLVCEAGEKCMQGDHATSMTDPSVDVNAPMRLSDLPIIIEGQASQSGLSTQVGSRRGSDDGDGIDGDSAARAEDHAEARGCCGCRLITVFVRSGRQFRTGELLDGGHTDERPLSSFPATLPPPTPRLRIAPAEVKQTNGSLNSSLSWAKLGSRTIIHNLQRRPPASPRLGPLHFPVGPPNSASGKRTDDVDATAASSTTELDPDRAARRRGRTRLLGARARMLKREMKAMGRNRDTQINSKVRRHRLRISMQRTQLSSCNVSLWCVMTALAFSGYVATAA